MHVSLISDEKIEELTQGTDFTVTDRVVTLAAPTGLKIKIYRQTATKPLVGWADASVLKAADMTVQSTQLLHLAEETSDLAQDGGLSKDTTDNVWDAKFNKIKNLLDPTDPGDAVTLSYITKNQDSLLTQLKNTGATQNSYIVATGDTQNARLNATGDTQNKRITDTGNAYVRTMTALKDTATTKANDASNSAELSKKWAVSTTSPDGAADSKSSKTWAEDARKSANNSAFAATASQNSATASATSSTNASNSANASKQSANASANSASASASSASAASISASTAKVSETNAAKSASAAAQSAKEAATFEPTNYYSKVEVDAKIPTKVSQLSNDANYTRKVEVDEIFAHIESGTTEDILLSGLTAKTTIIQTKYPHDTSKPVILSLKLPPPRPESNSWAGMIPVFEGWIDSTHFRLTAWNNNNLTSHCRFTWLCF